LSDAQAAHEKTMSSLLVALAGANVIYGMGMLDGGMTWSHEQLVIDNDIVKMVKHVIKGIDVNDETMAVDIIKQAHEIRDFLRQEHTVKHMRSKPQPKLFDRTTRGTWETRGSRDLLGKARDEAHRIIETHQPEPLRDDVKKIIREIITDAATELVPA